MWAGCFLIAKVEIRKMLVKWLWHKTSSPLNLQVWERRRQITKLAQLLAEWGWKRNTVDACVASDQTSGKRIDRKCLLCQPSPSRAVCPLVQRFVETKDGDDELSKIQFTSWTFHNGIFSIVLFFMMSVTLNKDFNNISYALNCHQSVWFYHDLTTNAMLC